MCETLRMMEADNDNEKLTFTRVGLAAKRVMERLFEEFDNPHANSGDNERRGETGSDKNRRANLTIEVQKKVRRI